MYLLILLWLLLLIFIFSSLFNYHLFYQKKTTKSFNDFIENTIFMKLLNIVVLIFSICFCLYFFIYNINNNVAQCLGKHDPALIKTLVNTCTNLNNETIKTFIYIDKTIVMPDNIIKTEEQIRYETNRILQLIKSNEIGANNIKFGKYHSKDKYLNRSSFCHHFCFNYFNEINNLSLSQIYCTKPINESKINRDLDILDEFYKNIKNEKFDIVSTQARYHEFSIINNNKYDFREYQFSQIYNNFKHINENVEKSLFLNNYLKLYQK